MSANVRRLKVGSLLPPAGVARHLAFAQLANSVGDGAFIVTSALFFTRVVGLSTAQVGLGLTIARDVARSHGGDIKLSKSPLGGLRATLRLPRPA